MLETSVSAAKACSRFCWPNPRRALELSAVSRLAEINSMPSLSSFVGKTLPRRSDRREGFPCDATEGLISRLR